MEWGLSGCLKCGRNDVETLETLTLKSLADNKSFASYAGGSWSWKGTYTEKQEAKMQSNFFLSLAPIPYPQCSRQGAFWSQTRNQLPFSKCHHPIKRDLFVSLSRFPNLGKGSQHAKLVWMLPCTIGNVADSLLEKS